MRDLSPRGMFVLGAAVPAVGQELRFELYAASGAAGAARAEPLVGQARVLWVAADQGAALEFLDLVLTEAQLSGGGPADSRDASRDSHAGSRKLVQHASSLGVDFGASQLRVAVAAQPEPRLLAFFDSRTTLAASCMLSDSGALVAGREAAEVRVLSPERTIHGAKSLLGRAHDPRTLPKLASHYGFELTATADHRLGARLPLGTQTRLVSMQEAATALFLELKRASEARLGAVSSSAVVGAPCHFDASQRYALLEASRAAGFATTRLVSETTAVAVAHAAGRKLQQVLLVVDVGAASTQAAVIELRGHEIATLAAAGDSRLGGIAFDERIASYLLERFREQHALPGSLSAQQATRLLRAAEDAKQALSFQPRHEAVVPYFMELGGSGCELRVELELAQLDALCAPLIERVLDLIERVLAQSPVRREALDELLLCGAMTHMPGLRTRIVERVGRSYNKRLLPEEAVARGLARLGDSQAGDAPLLLETLTEAIKIPAGTALLEVLPAGTPWPVKRTLTLRGEHAGPTPVHLFSGSAASPADCAYLASVLIEAAAGPRGRGEYNLQLELDEDGVLHASVEQADTGAPVACSLDYRRSYLAGS